MPPRPAACKQPNPGLPDDTGFPQAQAACAARLALEKLSRRTYYSHL